MTLSWTNPSSDFDQVTVFYKQGAAVSGTDDADATETNAGTAESYLVTGLTNGETYHFAVYTYKEEGGYSSGETVIAVPLSSGQTAGSGSSLPDTGQSQSYTTTFGEDHDYVGVPNTRSYTDNGDKTVTDNITSLMWEQLPDAGDHITKEWADAVTECENRTTANYTDWRLPTIHELRNLTNYNNSIPSVNKTYFPNTKSEYYWSLTDSIFNTGNAWRVHFVAGNALDHSKIFDVYVRCVRGDVISFGVNLTDNADGTVTDADTGQIWQQLEANHTAKNWEAALTYCEGLIHANRSDWRMPNINELGSIVDYNSYDPAIDTNYFPNTQLGDYWSSTTYIPASRYSFGANFVKGYVNAYLKTNNCFVRCVSGG